MIYVPSQFTIEHLLHFLLFPKEPLFYLLRFSAKPFFVCVSRLFLFGKTCVLFPTVIFVCIFISAKLELFSLSSSFSGFDFDLDEVWAPLNPHLRSLKSTSSTPRYTYLNFRAKNSLVAVVSIL